MPGSQTKALVATPISGNNFKLIPPMNESPVIGSLRLRKEFWDRRGANIVTRFNGTYGEKLFCHPKKRFCERLWLFATV